MLRRATRWLVMLSTLLCAGRALGQAKATYMTFGTGGNDVVWDAQELSYSPPSANSQYFVVATMKVPMGKYMVTAKMNGYAQGVSNATMECILYNSVDSTQDWTSLGFNSWTAAPLVFQMPVSFPALSGGTVGVKCRGMGHQDYDPNVRAQFHVWAGSFSAVQISSVAQGKP